MSFFQRDPFSVIFGVLLRRRVVCIMQTTHPGFSRRDKLLSAVSLETAALLCYSRISGGDVLESGPESRTGRGLSDASFPVVICYRRNTPSLKPGSFQKGIIITVLLQWPVLTVLIGNLSRQMTFCFDPPEAAITRSQTLLRATSLVENEVKPPVDQVVRVCYQTSDY